MYIVLLATVLQVQTSIATRLSQGTHRIREARRQVGFLNKVEGVPVSSHDKQRCWEQDRKRFKRFASLPDNISEEVEEVKIFPVTPDGIPGIHCAKLPSGLVTCRQNELQYNIKFRHKGLADEAVVSLVRALYSKLASIGHRRRKREEALLITAPPKIQKPPLIVILPATTIPPDFCEESDLIEETTEWSIKVSCVQNGCPESTETDWSKPTVSPFAIDCCPANFDPKSTDQDKRCLCDDPLRSTKRPKAAYIYSCKWHGKRDVENDLFLIPMAPPSFKIVIDTGKLTRRSIPIKVSFKNYGTLD